jgi:hypothetical protein
LLAAGQEFYIWRPLDWTSGAIDSILGVRLDRVDNHVGSVDPERLQRILAACDGDVEQARRILSVLT